MTRLIKQRPIRGQLVGITPALYKSARSINGIVNTADETQHSSGLCECEFCTNVGPTDFPRVTERNEDVELALSDFFHLAQKSNPVKISRVRKRYEDIHDDDSIES
jgi:hypothetical protein